MFNPFHKYFCFLLLILLSFNGNNVAAVDEQQYQIGTGIADITGPVGEIMLMGYAKLGQTGQGILQRIYARAFIVANEERRVVFVNTDTQSMGDIVKKRVIQQLQELYGDNLYTEQNVMLSSTHSHSSMGGYLQYSKSMLQMPHASAVLHACVTYQKRKKRKFTL